MPPSIDQALARSLFSLDANSNTVMAMDLHALIGHADRKAARLGQESRLLSRLVDLNLLGPSHASERKGSLV